MSAPDLDRTLAALADPRRRRVVDLLRERPRRAGELAEAMRISFPAMSRHLKTLRHSGLVAEDFITFNGGTHRDVVHMRTSEFRRLVRPTIVSLAREPALWH